MFVWPWCGFSSVSYNRHVTQQDSVPMLSLHHTRPYTCAQVTHLSSWLSRVTKAESADYYPQSTDRTGTLSSDGSKAWRIAVSTKNSSNMSDGLYSYWLDLFFLFLLDLFLSCFDNLIPVYVFWQLYFWLNKHSVKLMNTKWKMNTK